MLMPRKLRRLRERAKPSGAACLSLPQCAQFRQATRAEQLKRDGVTEYGFSEWANYAQKQGYYCLYLFKFKSQSLCYAMLKRRQAGVFFLSLRAQQLVHPVVL